MHTLENRVKGMKMDLPGVSCRLGKMVVLGLVLLMSFTAASLAAPLDIETTALNNWTVDYFGYDDTVIVTGGVAPYTWTINDIAVNDSFPSQMDTITVGTDGDSLKIFENLDTLSVVASYGFFVVVTDSKPGTPDKDSVYFTMIVSPSPTNDTRAGRDWLNSWTELGTNYSDSLESSGGTGLPGWLATGLPGTLTIDGVSGRISGTLDAGSASGSPYEVVITLSDSVGATAIDTFSLAINDPLVITTKQSRDSLYPWTENRGGYSDLLSATGGTGSITWSVDSLPDNLAISPATGEIAGNVWAGANSDSPYTVGVTITDSIGIARADTFTLQINPAPNFTGDTTFLAGWNVNVVGYSEVIQVNDGTAPFKWIILNGTNLPAGLSADTSSANTGSLVISGTPTTSGTFTFLVNVTDTAGASSGNRVCKIVINSRPSLNPSPPDTLRPWTVDVSNYSDSVWVTGGTPPYTWSSLSGLGMHEGLQFDSSGNKVYITGTPINDMGCRSFSLTAYDDAGDSATGTYTICISDNMTFGNADTLRAWTLNASGYSDSIIVNGGTAPFKYSFVSDSLPAGLSTDPLMDTRSFSQALRISGTPVIDVGCFTSIIKVTDNIKPNGDTSSSSITVVDTITICINPLLTITSPSTLAMAGDGVAYSYTLQTSGGTGNITWSASGLSGSQVSLSAAGVLAGEPNDSDPIVFMATAEDETLNSVSKSLTIPKDVTAPVFGSHSSSNCGSLVTIVTTDDGVGVGSISVSWIKGNDTSPSPVALSNSPTRTGPTSWSAVFSGSDWPADSVGLIGYELIINATDSAGNQTSVADTFAVSGCVPDTDGGQFMRASDLVTGNDSLWHLISFPGDLSGVTLGTLSQLSGLPAIEGDDDDSWRLLEHTGGNNFSAVATNQSIVSGKGYWFRHFYILDTLRLSSGTGTLQDTESPFAISLDNGWNIIGNPFHFPVYIDALQTQGTVNSYYQQQGKAAPGDLSIWWSSPLDFDNDALMPWGGYLVYCEDASCTVYLDPHLLPVKKIVAKWQATIALSSDGNLLDQVEIGTSPAAADGPDQLDAHSVSMFGRKGNMVIRSEENQSLIRDFRSDNELQSWVLDLVASDGRSDMTISWEGEALPESGMMMALKDVVTGQLIDMSTQSSHRISAPRQMPEGRFVIYLGEMSKVLEASSGQNGTMPGVYSLYQNFPNPFNPSTTIAYDLSQSGDVKLAVFNIIGQRVITLVDQYMDAGSYRVTWDGIDDRGNSVASGMYFTRMVTETYKSTRKMMLLK